MINLIDDIIKRFGPRVAGTEAEHRAQLYMVDLCKKVTNDVQFMSFEAYLNARFGKLKYYVGLFILSLIFYWIHPLTALIIASINTFFLVTDLLMYRPIITKFPGKKSTSWNVEATLEPQEKVEQTVIISGHMDSTVEYTWWYRFGNFGKTLTALAGFLMLAYFIFCIFLMVYEIQWANYLWFAFAVLSPITIVYWSMHGKEGVDGANDNLSGIAIAFQLFQDFASPSEKGKSTLTNTRLRFISFGSEERGLCGSKAYVEEFLEKVKQENTIVINFDSIRLVEELAIVTSESFGTKHDAGLMKGLKKTFEELDIPCKYTKVPVGGTDATPFARAGVPTISMLGITSKDFTYHTRLDVVENVESQALENAKNGVFEFIKRLEKQ